MAYDIFIARIFDQMVKYSDAYLCNGSKRVQKWGKILVQFNK